MMVFRRVDEIGYRKVDMGGKEKKGKERRSEGNERLK